MASHDDGRALRHLRGIWAFRDISIRRKLLAIIMLTSTVALLVAGSTFLVYELVTYPATITRQLTTLARLIARSSTAPLLFDDRAAANETLSSLQVQPNLVAACIYTKDGRPFAAFVRGESRRDLPRWPGAQGVSRSKHHLELYEPIRSGGKSIGTVYLNDDLRDMYARLERYVGIMLAALLVSALAALLLCYRLERVISQPILRLAAMAGRVSAERDYSLRAVRPGNDEIGALVDSFNGMLAQIQTSTLDLAEAQGALERHVSELCDEIARRERVEEELLAAKRAAEDSNRTKSLFLANMSHELRTPLNAIIGYSEMLREEAGQSSHESCARDLERIAAAGKQLLTLINDVLDLSKVEAGKTELVWEEAPVAQILRDAADVMAPLARKNHNQLVFECAPALPPVRVDVIKFRQSLYNLLSNACKFTEGGTITLEVAPVSDGGVDWIEWRVRDTGIGIAADQIPKLFQPFTQGDASTTRKYGGTGLGLAISQRFCDLMGGRITVESEIRKGSTFTIRLPYPKGGRISVSLPPAPEMAARPPASPLRTGTILVIDDDPAMQDILVRSLGKHGFHVVVASSGLEGLRQAREVRPAAITLDIFMPVMNGWAVLSALRTDPELSQIPVILVTICDDRKRACLLGATEFLQKPIQPEILIAALKRWVSSPTGAVLVVDDDPGSRDVAARVLRKHFVNVIEAADGRAALDCLAHHPVGLILLDLMMPGMDGFDVFEALHQVEAWRRIPVVVLTAKEITSEDRDRLRGVCQIVQKSDSADMGLARQIADLISERPPEPAAAGRCGERD